MGFYKGDYTLDSQDHRGWIVGTFIEDGPRRTDMVEVKAWQYKAGDTSHPAKVSSIIEVTIILSGKTEALMDGELVTLKAGDYLVIEPGTPNNSLHNILEDISGLTIKAPSDPSAKQLIKE